MEGLLDSSGIVFPLKIDLKKSKSLKNIDSYYAGSSSFLILLRVRHYTGGYKE